jgi:hypothetical protein
LHEKITISILDDAEVIAQLVSYGIPQHIAFGMQQWFKYFDKGTADSAHVHTSPELLAIAPPKNTFKDYIRKVYHK